MNGELATWLLRGAATVASAALVCALLTVVLRPLLERYALARPNPRSSHTSPTPQGGGIAVVLATIVAACGALHFSAGAPAAEGMLLVPFAATILIAAVGAADDIRSIEVLPRLILQALAVALVIYAVAPELRVVPFLPWWVERVLLVVGGLWFVNLVNFMDGLDWMTAAEIIPVTAALAAIGGFGQLPPQATAVALALCGAMLGFAYFNRPIAQLFLGDVGSLPIGLLVGWLLLLLATSGHLTAAIVLPLYYLADATITLLRRLLRGEPILQAHRTHFYQRATDRGLTVTEVVAWLFVVNVGLGALAIFTVIAPGKFSDVAALVGGAAIVAGLLFAFAHGRKRPLRAVNNR
jgi:UDP-N-acetylmuramyl pentapeptide phosphotransferase/UDP-N-acetylglucosamine-1-phosphate transferase